MEQYDKQRDAHVTQQAIEEEEKKGDKLKEANAIRIAQEKSKKKIQEEEAQTTQKKIKSDEPTQKYKELDEKDIYFLDKDGKEITDKSRNFVVGSHKLAKTMIECAADCIRECEKQNPDPQQKKLYNKWKVDPKTILECVNEVAKAHAYTYDSQPTIVRKCDTHNVAYVEFDLCGEKEHQIHLYPKFFQQSSEIAALTLIHEMTHDNSNTDDIDQMTLKKVYDNYPPIKEKGENTDVEDVKQLMIHMMKKYPDEMNEALESPPVIKEFKDLDLLEKFKSAVTNNTAELFWEELSEEALDKIISVYEDVLCVHISMDRACLVEFLPNEAAKDAECIARFAYDCYKYEKSK